MQVYSLLFSSVRWAVGRIIGSQPGAFYTANCPPLTAHFNDNRKHQTLTLRTAVIGVGHLGRQHARIHSDLASEGLTQFSSVCDLDEKTGRDIASAREVEWTSNWRQLIGRVDAVSLAVPTESHCEIACG